MATLSKQPFYFGINDTLQGDLTVSDSGEVKPQERAVQPDRLQSLRCVA